MDPSPKLAMKLQIIVGILCLSSVSTFGRQRSVKNNNKIESKNAAGVVMSYYKGRSELKGTEC